MNQKKVVWILRAMMVFVLAFSLILDPAAALAIKDESGEALPEDLPPGVELVGPFEVPDGLVQRGAVSLEVEKTVGTDPNVCATASEIAVLAGTDVTYCFEVTNTGTTDLIVHDLVDSELGTLLSAFPYNLVPGASAFLTATQTILTDTLGTATWTAKNNLDQTASDSDTTTVTVLVPDVLLTMTAGLDPKVCAVGDSLEVSIGAEVTYCYLVTNIGETDLVLHDLTDSELGALLSNFPYVLVPSASAFITQTATILADTVSTATWTGYAENGAPASSADSVTITVSEPPAVNLVTYLPFVSKK